MKRREALKYTAFLTGCGLSAATVSSIISGCGDSSGTLGDYTSNLDEKYVLLLADACEIIIPKTDTPGAREAKVHETIDGFTRDRFTEEDRTKFIEGLDYINQTAQDVGGKNFVKLSPEEQTTVLNKIADEGGENNIFDALKGLTIYTFFTSEPGAKQVLVYDPIPGEQHGCIPYEEVGKAWAL